MLPLPPSPLPRQTSLDSCNTRRAQCNNEKALCLTDKAACEADKAGLVSECSGTLASLSNPKCALLGSLKTVSEGRSCRALLCGAACCYHTFCAALKAAAARVVWH